jgi:hypothetical protein
MLFTQMDKAFKREFGQHEEMYDMLKKVFRDRKHAPYSKKVLTPFEVLGKASEPVTGDEHTDGQKGNLILGTMSQPSSHCLCILSVIIYAVAESLG